MLPCKRRENRGLGGLPQVRVNSVTHMDGHGWTLRRTAIFFLDGMHGTAATDGSGGGMRRRWTIGRDLRARLSFGHPRLAFMFLVGLMQTTVCMA